MSDQITLTGFEPPEYQEIIFLDSILPILQSELKKHGGNPEHLKYDIKKGYSTVSFLNFTTFRIHIRGKQHYISVPIVFADLISSSYPTKQVKSDSKYIRVLIDANHPVESYTNFLTQLAGETINRYPKEWDCCSRYMECSDAKACVHPDKEFALGCGYRKILNSGRIFYGKNRNVD